MLTGRKIYDIFYTKSVYKGAYVLQSEFMIYLPVLYQNEMAVRNI